MDLVQLTTHAYQLRGGSNAGLVVQAGRAVLVDTGLDKDAAKRILRHVEALKIKLGAVVITHAHADHFGGAATIKARTAAPIYAPALEAAIIENPILEPLYLFSGAMPPPELRHKFTLAEACKVDAILKPGPVVVEGIALEMLSAPGHAPNQLMVVGGEACFVADAVFTPEVLAKHGIPFMVDVDDWLKTLEDVTRLEGRYEAFVPGHGEATRRIGGWAGELSDRLRQIRRCVAEAIAEQQDISALARVCADRLGLHLANPTAYLLAQTALLACLTSLLAKGEATMSMEGNRLQARADGLGSSITKDV